jgi:hypothetical protein
MKKIGIIENMAYGPDFFKSEYEYANSSEIMVATGGNTGNVAFVYGVRKIIGDQITTIDWGTSPDYVNQNVDHIVICCANQLGEHVSLEGWADRISHFDKPITLIGLGAQASDMSHFPTLPDGTLRFLELVNERKSDASPNIAVRGEYTKALLDSLGINALAAGCPSLHISPDKNLGRSILERQNKTGVNRVAVAAGNPWHGPSAFLEPRLVEIVEKWHGEYVIQHPLGMLQFAYNEIDQIEPKTIQRFLDVYGPSFDQTSLLEWFRRYAAIFVDTPNWKRFLNKFDLVLGPRYHGIALGIQAGVPGTVVTIDSRTLELCEGTGVPNISLKTALEYDHDGLVKACLWDDEKVANFDNIRMQQRIKYQDFLRNQGVSLSKHFIDLLGE